MPYYILTSVWSAQHQNAGRIYNNGKPGGQQTTNKMKKMAVNVTGGKWKSNKTTSVPKSVPRLVVDKVKFWS